MNDFIDLFPGLLFLLITFGGFIYFLNLLALKKIKNNFFAVGMPLFLLVFFGMWLITHQWDKSVILYSIFFPYAILFNLGISSLIRFMQHRKKSDLAFSMAGFLLFIFRFVTPAVAHWMVRIFFSH